MLVRPYNEADFDLWDHFCSNYAFQATFLHTRKFISYHKNKFKDLSLIIEIDGDCVGLFPAAENLKNYNEVISHPGLSYGGLIFGSKLRGKKIYEALNLICSHYRLYGYKSLIYKTVPDFYHRIPADDDFYALHQLGAKIIRTDITTLIDLENRGPISNLRKRSLKKAETSNILISEEAELLCFLWEVLCYNLQKNHNTTPTHSIEELRFLMEKFPNNIKCITAIRNGKVHAGAIVFQSDRVMHVQYCASSEEGKKFSYLDLVFDFCIKLSLSNKKRWFDFGISTEDNGAVLNDSLQKYKLSFGGGSKTHLFFKIDL